MARRKCVCCGEWIGAGEASVPYKGRYAHEKCFNIAMKSIHNDKQKKLEEKSKSKGKKRKPAAELKNKLSAEEYKTKQQYYGYVRELMKEEELPAKVYAVSEDYIKKYNFSFDGMYQTLVYLNEIIKKELTGDIVGIIPYYYTEAEKYYKNLEKVEEMNKDMDISKMYHKKTIVIQPKKSNHNQIDITEIGDNN